MNSMNFALTFVYKFDDSQSFGLHCYRDIVTGHEFIRAGILDWRSFVLRPHCKLPTIGSAFRTSLLPNWEYQWVWLLHLLPFNGYYAGWIPAEPCRSCLIPARKTLFSASFTEQSWISSVGTQHPPWAHRLHSTVNMRLETSVKVASIDNSPLNHYREIALNDFLHIFVFV